MKRNKHSLSHYRLVTADMGRLVPVSSFEVLPGDTVQQATSLLLRVSPLMAPVMHPVGVRIHHWFVPYRILWDGWEDFITGGPTGVTSDPVPTVNTTSGLVDGRIGDYLGIPTGVPNLECSAFALRAYNIIWNEFYRDQDLEAEVQIDAGLNDTPRLISWEKDYFTAARPWTQKGPEVTMPIGSLAPVTANPGAIPTFKTADTGSSPFELRSGSNNGQVFMNGIGEVPATNSLQWVNPNLWADLSTSGGPSVNEVRMAFALQRYQEARAQYGSRYTEYLRYLGVRSSDARLQRPEYLGGGKQTIAFSEVLQTAPGKTEGDPTIGGGVGSFAGHGISAMRSRRYRRFFEEHGIVLSLMSVRPRSIYTNGLHRMFSRKTKEDFWQKELEQVGQQEVFRREVYAEADSGGSGGDAIFGYQDRYAEYKHHPSTIHGEFRNVLDYWHLARKFASAPALNSSFTQCDPTKRVFAEQTTHSLWVMVNNSIQARRMVRRAANSRII